MSFNAIEKILEDATGLDSDSIGSNVVRRVVKVRMDISGVADFETYHAKLQQDKGELQALIEDVTVPETWFFRDREPFELLSELVRAEWFPPSTERVLRILSVPCATGEEAYSIAMVMRNMGFNPDTVRIDAVDISKRALARAAAAEYRENSFRGDEGDYMRRFFDKSSEGYRLHDVVRRMVKFWHGNLLDEKFLAGAELYDIIFCRNVMIYFTRELQDKAVKKLHRLLAVNGLLFVGHAEAANVAGEYFSSVKRSGTFAFRKKIPGASKKNQEAKENLKLPAVIGGPRGASVGKDKDAAKRNMARRAAGQQALPAAADENPVPKSGQGVNAESVLNKIRRMADEGRLNEAAGLCEQYLESESGSAEAYYLLGLIREAEARDVDASNLFRKAVYLDPRHYEALVQLAVLAEAQGNLAAAAVYRARASRLAKEA